MAGRLTLSTEQAYVYALTAVSVLAGFGCAWALYSHVRRERDTEQTLRLARIASELQKQNSKQREQIQILVETLVELEERDARNGSSPRFAA